MLRLLTMLPVLLLLQPALAQYEPYAEVTASAAPTTLAQFETLYPQLNTTPEGAATLMLLALKLYSTNAADGQKALSLIVDPELLVADPDGYKGFSLRSSDLTLIKLQLKERTVKSYIKGTVAENDYAIKAGDQLVFVYQRSQLSGDPANGQFKIFAVSNGANSPRPLQLNRKPQNANGVWYVQDWSALLMPVR